MQILLIDDKPETAGDFIQPLRQAGHLLEIAESVVDAFAALAASEPDLVMLDLNLDSDSTKLHTALVKRGLPVLLFSVSDLKRLPEVARKRNWPFLAKPVARDALLLAVTNAVRGFTPPAPLKAATGPQEALSEASKAAVAEAPKASPSIVPPAPEPAPQTEGAPVVTQSKSKFLIAMETLLDFVALSILGGVLLVVKPENPYVQGGCIIGILLLAGVRAADLVSVAKGLPPRGGPAAILLAIGGTLLSRQGA